MFESSQDLSESNNEVCLKTIKRHLPSPTLLISNHTLTVARARRVLETSSSTSGNEHLTKIESTTMDVK